MRVAEMPRGFDELRVVQQHQRLQRRVRRGAAHGADSRVAGQSKVVIDGGGAVRFQNVYRLRR